MSENFNPTVGFGNDCQDSDPKRRNINVAVTDLTAVSVTEVIIDNNAAQIVHFP